METCLLKLTGSIKHSMQEHFLTHSVVGCSLIIASIEAKEAERSWLQHNNVHAGQCNNVQCLSQSLPQKMNFTKDVRLELVQSIKIIST